MRKLWVLVKNEHNDDFGENWGYDWCLSLFWMPFDVYKLVYKFWGRIWGQEDQNWGFWMKNWKFR